MGGTRTPACSLCGEPLLQRICRIGTHAGRAYLAHIQGASCQYFQWVDDVPNAARPAALSATGPAPGLRLYVASELGAGPYPSELVQQLAPGLTEDECLRALSWHELPTALIEDRSSGQTTNHREGGGGEGEAVLMGRFRAECVLGHDCFGPLWWGRSVCPLHSGARDLGRFSYDVLVLAAQAQLGRSSAVLAIISGAHQTQTVAEVEAALALGKPVLLKFLQADGYLLEDYARLLARVRHAMTALLARPTSGPQRQAAAEAVHTLPRLALPGLPVGGAAWWASFTDYVHYLRTLFVCDDCHESQSRTGSALDSVAAWAPSLLADTHLNKDDTEMDEEPQCPPLSCLRHICARCLASTRTRVSEVLPEPRITALVIDYALCPPEQAHY